MIGGSLRSNKSTKSRIVRRKSVEECEFDDIRTAQALNSCGLWVCDQETVEYRMRRFRRHLLRKLSSNSMDPEEMSLEMKKFCISLCLRHNIHLDWHLEKPSLLSVKKIKRKNLFKILSLRRFGRKSI
ncbi:unnamed protein product [Bursaphelenchus okinawaensis]|uniref:Uncharacterized protein n=1 Tax=Bursaphelenchus okinawaensis TaxID=465554 RepID=A0A811LM06_9BILA|nr:unnamed protein product [Bursaphelenchus okinawaensis]CAG9124552.1 unnamed protein product [Bursaphelenchus okinawaensis]